MSKTEDGYHHLTVDAEWKKLEPIYKELLKEYSKLTLPGFRPGKAPLSVIEKRYAKELLDDLSQHAAKKLGTETIRDAEIKVWGPAEIIDFECIKGKSFHADLRYHPRPEIELPDLKNLIKDTESDPHDQISLALLEQVQLEVPEPRVEEELDLNGIQAAPGDSEWVAAEQRIKLLFILKQIATQDGIIIEQIDVMQRIREKSVEFGTTEQQLKTELEQGDGSGLQRLTDMMLAESTLEYLAEIQGV